MPEISDPELEAERADASLDQALTAEAAHEAERDAHDKQGHIDEETRRHHLDAG